MSDEELPAALRPFARWVARHYRGRLLDEDSSEPVPLSQPPPQVRHAAAAARNAFLSRFEPSRRERLTVLAASDAGDSTPPTELRTPHGFRVSLSVEELAVGEPSSVYVRVQAPPHLLDRIPGSWVYLWHGDRRFCIGQFDPDGKALGALPLGIEIASSDLLEGRIELEEPDLPEAG